MAVVFIASVTTTKLVGPSSTFTVNMPSARPDNDLYVFVAGKDDDPDWTSIPGNWTSISTAANGTAGPRIHAWYWYGSSEPATYAINQDTEEAMGSVFRIQGAESTSPIDVSASDGTLTSANAPSLSVTTTADNALILACLAVDTDPVLATPSTTQVFGANNNSEVGDSGQVGFGVWSRLQETAGATPTESFTHVADTTARITIAVLNSTGSETLVHTQTASLTTTSYRATVVSTLPYPVIESTTTTKLATDSTTFTLNMPANRPDDDLYVCITGKDDDQDWASIPSNWTSIITATDGAQQRTHAWYWYGSSEPATYSISQDSEEAMGAIFRITGAHASSPIDSTGSSSVTGGTNLPSLSVTTTVDNTLVIPWLSLDNAPVLGAPATELVVGGSTSDVSAVSEQVGLGIWNHLQLVAGATSTAAFTNESDGHSRVTIAIAPPAAAGNAVDATLDTLSITDINSSVNASNLVAAALDTLTLASFNSTVVEGSSATNVTATLDTLSITDINSSVNASNLVDATLDTLSITGINPAVNVANSVSASSGTLAITGVNSTTKVDNTLAAALGTLVLTGLNTTVTTAAAVSATLDTMVITEFNSSVKVDNTLTAALDTLVLQDFNSTVAVGVNVIAGTEALSISEQNSTIKANNSVTSTVASLAISDLNTTITSGAFTGVTIDGQQTSVISANGGGVHIYFNESDYFTI